MGSYSLTWFEFGLLALTVASLWLLASTLVIGYSPRLSDSEKPSGEIKPVTVVIAARNEAANLPICLESLLAQEGIAQILVVDDHSEDGTLALAREIAGRTPEIMVLRCPAIPSGWVAKSFALQHGARNVTTPLILFTGVP